MCGGWCNNWVTRQHALCNNENRYCKHLQNVTIFKPILMFMPNTLFNSMYFWWKVLRIGTQCPVSGYKNLECVSVEKEDLPGLATALIRTSLLSDHFNASGKTPSIQTTDFPQPKYFPSSVLLCNRTTSLYSTQRTSLYADHYNSSGTIPYIRTNFPCIRTIFLHQEHFPTSGQFSSIQPTCFLCHSDFCRISVDQDTCFVC